MTYFVHTTVGCHGAESILGIKLLLNQSTFHDPIWKLELLNFQPSLEINFLPVLKYIMIKLQAGSSNFLFMAKT